jgi:hypothetical protein
MECFDKRKYKFRQCNAHYCFGAQDMPSLYYALLNIASAAEECDARGVATGTTAGYKKYGQTGTARP